MWWWQNDQTLEVPASVTLWKCTGREKGLVLHCHASAACSPDPEFTDRDLATCVHQYHLSPQSKCTFSEQRVQPLMQAEQPTRLLWSIKYHRQHCPRQCSQSNKGAAGQSRPVWKKPRVEWHLNDKKVRMGGVTGKTGPSSCLHVHSWALQIVLCMFHCGLWQL